jgi:carbonic anhydrase
MDSLIAGLKQFRNETYPEREEQFSELTAGQSPRTLLITCSDSRIVPSMVTSSGPGDLFVIRNAGNIVPPHDGGPGGEAATLEYAVTGLKVKHIVVCGHSQCGAMTALLNPELAAPMPSVQEWLGLAESTRASVEASVAEDATPEERIARAIELNTLHQLNNLRSHPSVIAAVESGDVQLHAWVYNIGSGAVTAYHEDSGEFVELNEVLHPVVRHLALVG